MFVLGYFALTLFTSATLLFFVQPMIGKMILPRLGGTPAVWNTCMVFFQAMLLLGYGYTHFVSTRLTRRQQLLLQACLLVAPFLLWRLPFTLGAWEPPGDSNPVFSVLTILAIVVGVPFFVVSTSAPLLQKWFAFTGHPAAKDPYFLYGASNLGSMLSLALYPVVMEPLFALEDQAVIWTVGYGVLAALVLGCIALIWRSSDAHRTEPIPQTAPEPAKTPDTHVVANVKKGFKTSIGSPKVFVPSPTPDIDQRSGAVTWFRRLRWIGLAAVPSSLMLGTTTFMTTDIAAIPFFWVLPLALYLLTFILVFAQWPISWTASNNKLFVGVTVSTAILAVVGLLFFVALASHLLKYHPDPFALGWPHAVYLLAFVLFFLFWTLSGTGSPHDFILYLQPCFILFLVLRFVANLGPPMWLEFTLHLFAFFFTTMMCHGELAKDRPDAKDLTEFYLWMSVGGVLGGIFNSLVAPHLFTLGVVEYPVAIVLSCFLRPNLVTDFTLFPKDAAGSGWRNPFAWAYDIGLPIVIALITAGFLFPGPVQEIVVAVLEWIAAIIATVLGWFGVIIRPILATRSFLMALPVIASLALAMRPMRFGLALGLLWIVVGVHDFRADPYVFRDRGFFGMVKVREQIVAGRTGGETVNYKYNTLIHGGIDHGRQKVRVEFRHEPCAYFHPLTGIGQVYMKLSWPNSPLPDNYKDFDSKPNPYNNFTLPNWRMPAALVGLGANPFANLVNAHSEPPFAVVGLGTGTLGAFAKPYQSVDFYEIDPLVYRLSRTIGDVKPPFTYLEDAKRRGANINVILGDGRLKIEKAPDYWYHILCLDAFASDAIPVHLLTVEAVQLYLKKLAPGGALVFNTTNRYVELSGVLRDIAEHLDLECWMLADWHTEMIPEKYGTDFVILRRNEKALARLADTVKSFSGGPPLPQRLDMENWRKLIVDLAVTNGDNIEKEEVKTRIGNRLWRQPERLGGRLWTDSYSNLLGVLKW